MNAACLKRYPKYGVGKYIGGKLYVHMSYDAVFCDDPEIMPYYEKARKRVEHLHSDYIVVAYNFKTHVFTFSWCADFDYAPEPTIGDQYIVYPDGTLKILYMNAKNPYIYHHKWLMVKPDYKGFDVEASKRRSLFWISLPDVDYSRIGKWQFWKANVLPEINKMIYQMGNFSIEVEEYNPITTKLGRMLTYTAHAYCGYDYPIASEMGTSREDALQGLENKLKERKQDYKEKMQIMQSCLALLEVFTLDDKLRKTNE